MGEANRRATAKGKIKNYRVKPFACPNCGRELDSTFGAEPGTSPYKVENKICICISCHHIFASHGDKVRNLNDEEIVEIAGNKQMVGVMNLLAQVKENMKRKKENE